MSLHTITLLITTVWVISVSVTLIACIELYKKYKKDPGVGFLISASFPKAKRYLKKDVFFSIVCLLTFFTISPFLFLVILKMAIQRLIKKTFFKQKPSSSKYHDGDSVVP